jgi:hypothetical protein
MVGCSGAQINLSVKYAIRIPANDCLERDIAELLMRPVGRPSHKPVVWYQGFLYQAASWKTARRLRLAEGHLTQRLFGAMLRRVSAMPRPAR